MHEIALEYDRALNVWTLHYTHVEIFSSADIIAWRTIVSGELQKLGGARVDLLVDVDGLFLDRHIGEIFVSLSEGVLTPSARAVIGYGRPTEATLAAFEGVTIEPTRDLALQTLQRIRDARSRGGSFTSADEVESGMRPLFEDPPIAKKR